MASVHRQTGKKNWFCAYTDAEGKRHFKTTGTTNKKEAQKVCQAMQRAVDASRTGRLTPSKARALIEDAIAEIMGDSMGGMGTPTPREFLTEWAKNRKGVVRPNTWTRYDGVVRTFNEDPVSNLPRISALGPGHILEYRDRIAERTSAMNANMHLKILRQAFKVAVKRRLLDVNPADLVESLSTRGKLKRRPFTPEEVEAILGHAEGEWKTMVLLGLHTGQRLGDLTKLTWASVDFEQGVIAFEAQKTATWQISVMPPGLAEHLKAIPPGSANSPIMPNLSKALKPSNQFYDLMATAGIVEKRRHTKAKAGRSTKREMNEISFHSFRHTLVTNAHKEGISMPMVQKMAGHKSEKMSLHYSHVDLEAMREAAKKMPYYDLKP